MIQDFLQRLAAIFDQPWIPWKRLIYGFTIGEFCLENWLLYRQYRVLQRTTIPKALENQVDQKTFDKSQTYGRAKARYSFIRSCFDVAKSLATVYFNLFPRVWSFAGLLLPRLLPARFQGEITQSLVFIFIFNYIDLIYGLPFSYYHTFYLEEKFGFNKTTLNTWIKDILKGQALTIVFGVPIGSAFLKIIQLTGQSFFYYLWVFMFLIQVAAMTIYPIWIMPLFNKFTPLEPGPLKENIDALAAKLKFPLSELLVIDGSKRSSHSNAFFTGLPWKKRIVIYDTLLQKSSNEEVEAVLAHELGHWKRGHTTRLLMISQVQTFYVFALFSAFINNSSLFRSFGFDNEKPIIIGFLLYSAVSSCTEPLLSLGMHMLTRAYEYEADAFAATLGYTEHLCSGLVKLQVQNLSSMDADWMYSAFHYTHPILTERLRAMGWKGDKKVTEKGDGGISAEATGREL